MTETERRAAVVAEALSWLRTPYVNMGNIKGLAADCAMLQVEIFRQPLGSVPLDFDPRPYSPDWHLHQNEAVLLKLLRQFAHPVDAEKPGDIAAYCYGKHISHLAVIASDTHVIHAHRRNGNVELCERRAMEERLDSYWSIFP